MNAWYFERLVLLFRRVFYFFPLQLVLVNLRRNHLILIFWVVMFGLVMRVIATKYGIPQLLLYPEYLGKVGVLSHFITGLTLGAFIMAFNITSYITNGSLFPFIATLYRPFLKYCLNNFIVPGAFLTVYGWNLYQFQRYRELIPPIEIAGHLVSLLAGVSLFIYLTVVYFMTTNRTLTEEDPKPNSNSKMKRITHLFGTASEGSYKSSRRFQIETYLTSVFRIKRARPAYHYSDAIIQGVLRQNHINASVFELGAIATIALLGLFMERKAFAIPAGASLFLMFTLFVMLAGAVYSWTREWSTIVFIGGFLLFNQISKNPEFRRSNIAYGMNYDEPVPYNNARIDSIHKNRNAQLADYSRELLALEAWKEKTGEIKPRIIIITTSGGGLRSTLWAFHALQQTDSALAGNLYKHTRLITGASGGLIGASIYRELALRHVRDGRSPVISSELRSGAAGDLLNTISFTWVVNDLFFRYKKGEIRPGYSVYKDRGYMFEKQLNNNTFDILNKPLSWYRPFEQNGDSPALIISPTITNDGRRLHISPSSYRFLSVDPFLPLSRDQFNVEAIDFRSYFSNCQPDSLMYTTALRINATFPYVLPTVGLPSIPALEVMDAGVRDNYGFLCAAKYVHVLRDWINRNTSGVVFVRISDRLDAVRIREDPFESVMNSIVSPVGSVYGNIFNIQRFTQEEILQLLQTSLSVKLELIDFAMARDDKREIPLSWHLSQSEVKTILNSLHTPINISNRKRLDNLLKPR